MRSPTLLLIRMNAAETSDSRAMADCTPLAVVSRSSMTAEIDTFISDVSTTRTNMAMASSTIRRRLPPTSAPAAAAASDVMAGRTGGRPAVRVVVRAHSETWPSLHGGRTASRTGVGERLVRRGRDAGHQDRVGNAHEFGQMAGRRGLFAGHSVAVAV